MLSYDVMINSYSLYRVRIKRDEPLSTLYKYNKYSYLAINSIGVKYEGKIKHKYIDGVFILMNKVNKKLHVEIKKNTGYKDDLHAIFKRIKENQNEFR